MQSCFLGYLDPIGLLDVPLMRHEDESNYMLLLAASIGHSGEVKRRMGLNSCCLHQPYYQYLLMRDADAWYR